MMEAKNGTKKGMKTIKYYDRFETLNDKGEMHSFDDKPAVERVDGRKEWYKEGKRHRLNGPAIELINRYKTLFGYKMWYKEGKLHRIGGPAVEHSERGKLWCEYGKRHRIDGPARIYNDGIKIWYYEDKEIECSSTEEFLKIIKLKAFW